MSSRKSCSSRNGVLVKDIVGSSEPTDANDPLETEPTVAEAHNRLGTNRLTTIETLPERSVLQPIAPPKPKRKVDLSMAVLPGVGNLKTLEALCVRELKGVGATFTSNLEGVLIFHGLVYKPLGEFEARHQILAGPLLKDPRVLSRAQRIAFVPAFSWTSLETVLMPVKLNTYGQRTLADLQKLQLQFPKVKAFVQWSESKKRHVVHYEDLSAQELEVVGKVQWPTQDDILEALDTEAYDNLDDLTAANEEIRILLGSREVD